MINIEEYISSGILELYVAGALSPQEEVEVTALVNQHPELQQEVEEIEAALLQLSAAASPGVNQESFSAIQKLLRETKVVALPSATSSSTKTTAFIGWAAAILALVGLFFIYQENQALESQLSDQLDEKERLQDSIQVAAKQLEELKIYTNAIRREETVKVKLAGQAVSPTSVATVHWDKKENKVYIDASGLPEPPPGKVYQVWSLKLEPLTPTSIGLLDDFASDDNKVFILPNANTSEAFGITLEPAGGSDAPTMEQLYTLGAV
ncbi:hypothetical protein GCM10009117_24200 [Gangjinia marincola]|uniref:Anti-sigma K factor RskA C-terminal domain-containing protein n=1 Tax=Gangjinia marincola TaxID=578463 RepID=A0ABN1MJ81_9FLAO